MFFYCIQEGSQFSFPLFFLSRATCCDERIKKNDATKLDMSKRKKKVFPFFILISNKKNNFRLCGFLSYANNKSVVAYTLYENNMLIHIYSKASTADILGT